MCSRPLLIQRDKNLGDVVAQCRKCDECMKARKRAWIGRLLAEEKTAAATWFATFTYGGGYDNDKAYSLDYADLQKLFKRIRKAGHKFSYLAVGEYGTEKSRAHFHVLFFWKSSPPPVEKMDARIDWPFWDLGFTQIEFPRSAQGAAAYVMDYLDKDNLNGAKLKFSKNPALGATYLVQYAERQAVHGLSLFQNGNTYTVDGNVNPSTGENWFYHLDRDSVLYSRMMMAYLRTWSELRPTERIPQSAEFADWFDDLCQDTSALDLSVQQYIAENYGFYPVAEYSPERKVLTLHPQVVINETHFGAFVEVRDNTGELVWLENVEVPRNRPPRVSRDNLLLLLAAQKVVLYERGAYLLPHKFLNRIRLLVERFEKRHPELSVSSNPHLLHGRRWTKATTPTAANIRKNLPGS